MNTLYLIPARGGSRGLPGKNIRPLAGKALILYSIDLARKFSPDEHICVSSEDDEIIKTVNDYGLATPYIRPSHLATDEATTYAVIQNVLRYYLDQGLAYDTVVVLQPTSPLRQERHLAGALEVFGDEDVLMSACISEANPYYSLFEETEEGLLYQSKEAQFSRRQDAPKVYQLNGAIYIINVSALQKYDSIQEFGRKKKYLMESLYSVDIDNIEDFEYCEYLLSEGKVSLK